MRLYIFLYLPMKAIVDLQRVHGELAAGAGPEPRDGRQHRRAHATVAAGTWVQSDEVVCVRATMIVLSLPWHQSVLFCAL